MSSLREIVNLSSKQLNENSDMHSIKSHREFITKIFYDECMKLGKWEPFEDMKNENPLFWWLGNGFYKYRDFCFSIFTKYPFSKIELSLGEFLIHFFLITISLGFWVYCSYITYNDPTSLAFGKMSSVSMLLVFLFSGKMSIWNLIFGLPHERQLQFHKTASLCMVVTVLVHAIVKGIQKWQGITGLIYGITIFLLLLFAINVIRRYNFEIINY